MTAGDKLLGVGFGVACLVEDMGKPEEEHAGQRHQDDNTRVSALLEAIPSPPGMTKRSVGRFRPSLDLERAGSVERRGRRAGGRARADSEE